MTNSPAVILGGIEGWSCEGVNKAIDIQIAVTKNTLAKKSDNAIMMSGIIFLCFRSFLLQNGQILAPFSTGCPQNLQVIYFVSFDNVIIELKLSKIERQMVYEELILSLITFKYPLSELNQLFTKPVGRDYADLSAR